MKAEILKYFDEASLSISPDDSEKLCDYYKLLIEYNAKFNLTSITEETEVIIKHFLDSALLFSCDKDFNGKSLADVGTGAGFPGMVLSILNPNLNVSLIESAKKKCDFLETVIKNLSLNAKVYNLRAEDAGKDSKLRESFDFATSRAVARINILMEYLLPLVKIDGEAICYKGAGYPEEMDEAGAALKKLGGETFVSVERALPKNMGERAFVFAKKINPTPDGFPRRAGIPVKRPITSV